MKAEADAERKLRHETNNRVVTGPKPKKEHRMPLKAVKQAQRIEAAWAHSGTGEGIFISGSEDAVCKFCKEWNAAGVDELGYCKEAICRDAQREHDIASDNQREASGQKRKYTMADEEATSGYLWFHRRLDQMAVREEIRQAGIQALVDKGTPRAMATVLWDVSQE